MSRQSHTSTARGESDEASHSGRRRPLHSGSGVAVCKTQAHRDLFPSSAGGRLSRSSAAQRLALAVAQAARKTPALAGRAISPHTIRHTTAMHLLQSGVDITVIALWLGHEDPSTTHIYLEADLAMKEGALNWLQPIAAAPARYHPPDQLMAFLQSL